MSHILVSGSIAYDRIMDFPGLFKEHFVADMLHSINVSFAVQGFTENFGGTAGNIAYNLAVLGQTPRIIATAGSDFERYAGHLRSVKVDPTSVKIDTQGSTSSAFIITDRANNQIAAFSMAAGGTEYLPLPDTDGVRTAIVGAGCVQDMENLPAYYRAQGIEYFYDPGQQIPALSREQLRDGITGARGLFANDYELSLITKKTGLDEAGLLQKVPALIVTLGEKGSRVVTKEGEASIKAVPVTKVVDPTGAGDAYRAGFIAGFLSQQPLERAAKIGSAAAAYAVEKYGTQSHRFTIAELGERYKAAYGETLSL
ncbi:MAG: carbohydrate kinase family protein [bacterium]|nr:carbohydrate kinase family protein [bacterium]